MRVHLSLLLTASVVTDTANVFGFEGMEATLASTSRSGVVDYDRVRDDRQSLEHGGMDGEERMLGDELVTTVIKNAKASYAKDILTKLRVDRSEDMLTKAGRERLDVFEEQVIEQFVAKLSVADILKYRKLDDKEAVENLITHFSNHKDGKEHFLKALFNTRDMGNEAASRRRIEVKEGGSNKRKREPEDGHIQKHGTLNKFIASFTLDETLTLQQLKDVSRVFGGWAKFSSALSIASKSGLLGHKAMILRNAMIKEWLKRGKTVDEVYRMLRVSKSGKDGLTYENLDTFIQFVELHNKEVAGSYTFWMAYLTTKLGTDEFEAMLSKGAEKSQYAKEIKTKLFELWKKEGSPTTCCFKQLGDADVSWEDIRRMAEHHRIAMGETNHIPDKPIDDILDKELDAILYGGEA